MSKLPEADNYKEINQIAWDEKVAVHLQSDFYNVAAFKKGWCSLKTPELKLLGDIKGKKILHLQCHFGQDSISLARMGGQVTGVDFSPKAIHAAQSLSSELDIDIKFICCDIYSLKEQLNEKFDLVFTSYGTIGWLPDVSKWAEIVGHFLKLGGNFIMADFHPFIWTFDDKLEFLAFDYFNTGPIVEEVAGTYADSKADICNKTIGWNHSLASLFQALIDQGINIKKFDEHDYSPYSCFQNLEEQSPAEFRFKHIKFRIPMMYSILGEKTSINQI